MSKVEFHANNSDKNSIEKSEDLGETMINKRGIIIIAILMMCTIGTFMAQETNVGVEAPPSVQAGNEFVYLDLIEDFENAEDWVAYSTTPVGETRSQRMVQVGDIKSTSDDIPPREGEAYSINQRPNNPNHILGIKTYFNYSGIDRVEIKPPQELMMRGIVKQFSVWVLGRGYRHSLYVKVRDYRNKIHRLNMGSLNFLGWRKMIVIVPTSIRQPTKYGRKSQRLRFVSLFVESNIHEKAGIFYFYVDGLKAIIDRSGLQYPGSEIRDNW